MKKPFGNLYFFLGRISDFAMLILKAHRKVFFRRGYNGNCKKEPPNTKKTVGKTSFCNIGNPHRGNLTSTVVYEDIWMQFTEK